MFKYVDLYVKTCPVCQAVKDPAPKVQSRSPLGKIEANYPWELVCIDIWGPVTRSRSGNRYVLTVIDAFSKWALAIPLPTKDASTVASRLWGNVFSVFGMPVRIHTDQGKEFCNDILKEMVDLFGIDKSTTSAYHPQGNAIAERIHRFYRNAITAFVRDDLRNWDELLPGLQLAYNDAVHESLGVSPSEAFLGRVLNAPGDIPPCPKGDWTLMTYSERLKYILARTQELIMDRNPRLRLNQHHKLTTFQPCDLVAKWTPKKIEGESAKLLSKWSGPFKVIRSASRGKVYYLEDQLGDVINQPVSVLRLKPYYDRKSLMDDHEGGVGDLGADLIPPQRNESRGVGLTEPLVEQMSKDSGREDDSETDSMPDDGAIDVDDSEEYIPSKSIAKQTQHPQRSYNLRPRKLAKYIAAIVTVNNLVKVPLSSNYI